MKQLIQKEKNDAQLQIFDKQNSLFTLIKH